MVRSGNMAKSAYFGPELFAFLSELKNNNEREWFLANKGRYEEFVREPFLRLIFNNLVALAHRSISGICIWDFPQIM